jgi:hypothetical protein
MVRYGGQDCVKTTPSLYVSFIDFREMCGFERKPCWLKTCALNDRRIYINYSIFTGCAATHMYKEANM